MKFNREELSSFVESKGKKMSFSLGARPVGAVDEKQRVIHDVSICNEGEALGHGVHLDADFIQACVDQGNLAEKGLLCHFGHGDSNADRIKNYMGTIQNFVCKPSKSHEGLDVTGCFADIKFSKTAAKLCDNVDWVLGLARERPDALGMSIVFDVGGFKLKMNDGSTKEWRYETENLDEDGNAETFFAWLDRLSDDSDGKIYVLLGKLHGADFVAEGAATDGLFEKGEKAMIEKAKEEFASTASEQAEATTPAEPTEEKASEEAAKPDEEANADDKSNTPEPSTEAPPEEAKEVSEDIAQEEDTKGFKDVKQEEENKRVAGLQKFHAQKEAEWNKIREEIEASRDQFEAQLDLLRNDFNTKKEELEKILAEREGLLQERALLQKEYLKVTEDLSSTKEKLDAEVAAHEATKKDLDSVRASLKIEADRVRLQIGHALGRPLAIRTNEDVMLDPHATPEQKIAAANAEAARRRKSN